MGVVVGVLDRRLAVTMVAKMDKRRERRTSTRIEGGEGNRGLRAGRASDTVVRLYEALRRPSLKANVGLLTRTNCSLIHAHTSQAVCDQLLRAQIQHCTIVFEYRIDLVTRCLAI